MTFKAISRTETKPQLYFNWNFSKPGQRSSKLRKPHDKNSQNGNGDRLDFVSHSSHFVVSHCLPLFVPFSWVCAATFQSLKWFMPNMTFLKFLQFCVSSVFSMIITIAEIVYLKFRQSWTPLCRRSGQWCQEQLHKQPRGTGARSVWLDLPRQHCYSHLTLLLRHHGEKQLQKHPRPQRSWCWHSVWPQNPRAQLRFLINRQTSVELNGPITKKTTAWFKHFRYQNKLARNEKLKCWNIDCYYCSDITISNIWQISKSNVAKTAVIFENGKNESFLEIYLVCFKSMRRK